MQPADQPAAWSSTASELPPARWATFPKSSYPLGSRDPCRPSTPSRSCAASTPTSDSPSRSVSRQPRQLNTSTPKSAPFDYNSVSCLGLTSLPNPPSKLCQAHLNESYGVTVHEMWQPLRHGRIIHACSFLRSAMKPGPSMTRMTNSSTLEG